MSQEGKKPHSNDKESSKEHIITIKTLELIAHLTSCTTS